MQHRTQKTIISIISDHVDAWRRSTGMSREAISELIITKYRNDNKHRLPGVKDFSNDKVKNVDEAFEARRVNADRIFRWLDDRSKDSTFLPANFIPSVLGSMPDDLRISCVNQILIQLDMFAQNIERPVNSDSCCNPLSHLKKLIKESREAEQSLCELIENYDQSDLMQAQKELSDLVQVAKEGLVSVSVRLSEMRAEGALKQPNVLKFSRR